MTDTLNGKSTSDMAGTMTPNSTIGPLAPGPFFIVFLALFMVAGCAGLAGKGRMEQFENDARAYEWSLEIAEYHKAAKYLDPSIKRSPVDFDRYANIKISDYKVARIKVSEDRQSIEQDVALQYFLLDRNIIKTTMDRQVWRYNDAKKSWMLQTGLPNFPR